MDGKLWTKITRRSSNGAFTWPHITRQISRQRRQRASVTPQFVIPSAVEGPLTSASVSEEKPGERFFDSAIPFDSGTACLRSGLRPFVQAAEPALSEAEGLRMTRKGNVLLAPALKT